MRVVLDTNILLSALMVRHTPPDRIYTAWVQTKFELATSEVQITELRAVSRRPELRSRLRPSEVGHLVNELRALALFFADLPDVTASPDPDDNFLLAIAQASQADYLVTGDKSGLLALERYEGTNIITARAFVESVLSWP
jgi:putative PIN family toxin of toxin-antitoxin system